ncbi:unnamed protein product [Adineta ricciae]|uniref:EGF-like domain-containing protein n=1 Tax=Adineta ricciae TaxID=249248 RepID=A0A813TJI4_ADIRI|nr:unnamed protein product [Adineta ricciae]CAF1148618.1 unnamed protein product [Adineta ricciae]
MYAYVSDDVLEIVLIEMMMIYFDCYFPIESVDVCPNINGSRSLWLITFGNGSEKLSNSVPSHINFTTTYKPTKDVENIDVGQFILINTVPSVSYTSWHVGAKDHTLNDSKGYMMIVNVASSGPSKLFEITVDRLYMGLRYEFSAYLANVNKQGASQKSPNVWFQARAATGNQPILNKSSTGDLPELASFTWSKHTLLFKTNTSSVILSMIPNDHGGNGRNLAIDDIELRVCSNISSEFVPLEKELTTTEHQASSTTAQQTRTSQHDTTMNNQESSTITISTETSTTQASVSTTSPTTMTPDSKSTFVPEHCGDPSHIGSNCDKRNSPCDMREPCQNNSTCVNNNTALHGYICVCPPNITGMHCEHNHRFCMSHICLNNGVCNETSRTCVCSDGWGGAHCEWMINLCEKDKITCSKNGVCRPLLVNYTCECFSSYSGRHCELMVTKIRILKIVSKSVSFVAILILVIFILFIVIMDVLKYCFGMDLTREELQRYRREKQARKRKRPVVQRFTYVDKPTAMKDTSV